MTTTAEWNNQAIDEKLNSLNASLNTLTRMVEDLLRQIDTRRHQQPNPQNVLEQYRKKITAMMTARGADSDAIKAFEEMLSINLSDVTDQGTTT